jgi:hypothetical protein
VIHFLAPFLSLFYENWIQFPHRMLLVVDSARNGAEASGPEVMKILRFTSGNFCLQITQIAMSKGLVSGDHDGIL